MAEPVLVLPRAAYRRNRTRWLETRRSGIGGSDAAAVLGLSPWSSPLSLWLDKVHGGDDARRSEAMRWGTVLEDAIAREMAREHGIRLGPCPGILAHPDRRHQLATIDRYGVDRDRRPTSVVEVKTADGFAAADWDEDGPAPDHVVIQVQHQLDVTGLDVGYVAALVGGNRPRWWEVPRDDELITDLRMAEDAFWHDHVLAGVPPEPIGHDADGDALAELYPGDPDRQVILDGPTRSDVESLRMLKAHIAEAKSAAELHEQRIKAYLGDATEGLLPDGSTAITWRPSATTRLDSTALKASLPDVWAEYATTSEGRRLLVKKTKENRTDVAAA